MIIEAIGNSRRWARIQAGSGLVFLAFALLHLLNTALAALGAGPYNAFQRRLRPVYQYPAIEIGLILLPLLVHVVAGVARMRMRKGVRAATSLRVRSHRYAGYVLLAFVFGHIAATRGPALLRGVYPEFEGVAYTFQAWPYWFYPYYAALPLAGVLHAAIGAPLALGVFGVKVPAPLRRGVGFWLPVSVAALAVLLGWAGLGGLLHPLSDMSQHAFARLLQDLSAQLTGARLNL